PAAKAAVPALLAALKRPKLREEAIGQLAFAGRADERVLDELLRSLETAEKEDDIELLVRFGPVIGKLMTDDNEKRLMPIMKRLFADVRVPRGESGAAPSVRDGAIVGLGAMRGRARPFVPDLVKLLEKTKGNAAMRFRLLEAIKKIDPEEAKKHDR